MKHIIKCELCDREFSKMGMNSHVWRSHGDGKGFGPMKGKQSWNKGMKFYGTWEVKFAQYLDAINVEWEQPSQLFSYEFDGIQQQKIKQNGQRFQLSCLF